MRVMIVVVAIAVSPPARADALDDEIARELCGATPSADGRDVPNCTVGESARRAFVVGDTRQSGDDERPPPPPEPPPSAQPQRVVVLGPDLEHVLRWDTGVGVQIGSARVDGNNLDYKLGLTLSGGIRFDRLAAFGEYTLSGVEYTGPVGLPRGSGMPLEGNTAGVMQRIGAVARYAIAKGTSTPEMNAIRAIVEYWIEAGVGEEHIAWDKGGIFDRPDVVVGTGFTGAWRGSHRYGTSIAFRIYFGRRTDLDDAGPTCSAPCTQASKPAAWTDRAYMLDMSYAFGN
jgi:hypothetical protein